MTWIRRKVQAKLQVMEEAKDLILVIQGLNISKINKKKYPIKKTKFAL